MAQQTWATMSRMFGAAGDQPLAVQAAHDFLNSGGSAVGAVLSGFFLEAGARAGVLLGPLVVIVAGIGSGVRVFDGRLRQPGLGTKRPRGFTSDERIPGAARFAVPQAIAAAVVAHAYDRTGSFAEVLRRGIRQARQLGAEARAGVLEGVQAQGARFLGSPQIARSLLHVAGVSEGGLLTTADLAAVPSLDFAALVHPEMQDWTVAPWQSDDSESPTCAVGDASGSVSETLTSTMLLCAVDSRGTFAGLCYQNATQGVVIEALEIEAPSSAVPVMRGVPRVAPGTCLPAPAPLAVQVSRGKAVSIVGDATLRSLSPGAIMNPRLRIQRHPDTRQVTVNHPLPALGELAKLSKD
jgi:hypothetical protein